MDDADRPYCVECSAPSSDLVTRACARCGGTMIDPALTHGILRIAKAVQLERACDDWMNSRSILYPPLGDEEAASELRAFRVALERYVARGRALRERWLRPEVDPEVAAAARRAIGDAGDPAGAWERVRAAGLLPGEWASSARVFAGDEGETEHPPSIEGCVAVCACAPAMLSAEAMLRRLLRSLSMDVPPTTLWDDAELYAPSGISRLRPLDALLLRRHTLSSKCDQADEIGIALLGASIRGPLDATSDDPFAIALELFELGFAVDAVTEGDELHPTLLFRGLHALPSAP